jgi:hypothetical protein
VEGQDGRTEEGGGGGGVSRRGGRRRQIIGGGLARWMSVPSIIWLDREVVVECVEGTDVGGVVGEREGGWDGTEKEARRSRVRPQSTRRVRLRG